MGRIPRPSPAMVVATISLIVAIGGTAFALPGKFTVGRDDIKTDSVGASALGRNILNFGTSIRSMDPVAGDGIFTDVEGLIKCPSKAPFAFDPSTSGLGREAFEARRSAFPNRFGGPGSYRIVISSDEGSAVFYGLKINCLASR